MAADLHGTNGLPVKISIKLYETYVQTRVLYGIESIKLTKSDVNNLELFPTRAPRKNSDPRPVHIVRMHPHDRPHSSPCTDVPIIPPQRANHERSSRPPICHERYKILYLGCRSTRPTPEIQPTNYTPPTRQHPIEIGLEKKVKSALYHKISCDIKEEAQEKSTLRYLAPYHTPRATQDSVAHINNSQQVT